jgi:hypothetical protein
MAQPELRLNCAKSDIFQLFPRLFDLMLLAEASQTGGIRIRSARFSEQYD